MQESKGIIECIGCKHGNKPSHGDRCMHRTVRLTSREHRTDEEKAIIDAHYAKHGKPCDIIVNLDVTSGEGD